VSLPSRFVKLREKRRTSDCNGQDGFGAETFVYWTLNGPLSEMHHLEAGASSNTGNVFSLALGPSREIVHCADWREVCGGRLRSSSGSLAMVAAIRRASSRVTKFAAARRPGSSSVIDERRCLLVGDASCCSGSRFNKLGGKMSNS
jgi:hypothetical protein